MENSPEKKKMSTSPGNAERARKRRSRSRERRRRSYSRSKSKSPVYRGGGGYRGNRFNRRSPDRFRGQRNFNRFNRSRSRSRDNRPRGGGGRRFDNRRRSRSESPRNSNNNAEYMQQHEQQQQQHDQQTLYSDAYGNAYIPNAPSAPQFAMNTQYGYDYQGTGYPPPPPSFAPGIDCPAPPGMSEGWVPPPNIQPGETDEDKAKREAAVAEEKKRQREGLKKQRDQYINRSDKMKRELKELKQQKSDLVSGHGKRSPSPKTNGFIKENEKLQSAISSKLLEIGNVVDMLDSLIGKGEEEGKKKGKKGKKSDSDSSPERIKSELLESMKKKKKEAEEKKLKFNYIIYDPELHWCKVCNVFPKTAKDYLLHLHTKEHAEKNVKIPAITPWRESFQKSNEVTSHPDAPTKRAPIRGLQFFEPATAWFCKLCEVFMGDTFCASLHLKSEIHSEKYAIFIAKEPKFEDKWLEMRKKALEGTEPNGKTADKKAKKKKNKRDSKKDKKKRGRGKKRKRDSSSSSNDSDDSDSSSDSDESSKKNSDEAESKNSIRVQMRNMQSKTGENDERSGKWTMVSANANKPVPPPAPSISQNTIQEKKKDELILNQWSKVEPIISQEEKRLLENLKGKLKNQQKPVEEKKPEENRSRSREIDRSRDRNYRRRSRSTSRRRSRSLSRRRSRSRSRSRDRRSRSRSRGRYRRSRSRSRGRRRVERAVVNFPSEPRLPPSREDKKLPARSYVITKVKEDPSSNAKKVMPMIGKMPVFKKQLSEKKSEELMEYEKVEEPPMEEEVVEVVKQPRDDSWDEMMPDPLQYSALMGAPPPPPRMEEPEPCVPPGLDPEMDDIPKPISDAPIARKGPLPKDFQDTLDLLYDGDRPKPVEFEVKVIEVMPVEPPPMMVPDPDGPQMMTAEELSQHALLYGGFYAHNADGTDPNEGRKNQPEPTEKDPEPEENTTEPVEAVDDEKKEQQMDEMDDLAMLGIDVNDVGSGVW